MELSDRVAVVTGPAKGMGAAVTLALTREGGLYRETYRSDLQWPNGRAAGTAIYYLLAPDTFSALHRLASDEVFHFYLGDPVEMVQLDPQSGEGRRSAQECQVRFGHQLA